MIYALISSINKGQEEGDARMKGFNRARKRMDARSVCRSWTERGVKSGVGGREGDDGGT
jgi:hypothetical protein